MKAQSNVGTVLRSTSRIHGSFPAIRDITGRRPRRFSLFMKIFRILPFPFFFLLSICLCWV
ncbi:hypothetical protein VL10_16615 [Leclercia adecarboxylata]|nr:hypothetical protein VL10_16615 [Leclercia adecarboxylata]KMN61049.1 hypothetical protein VK95_23835 [Leclercia sp. LK8]